MNWDLSITKCYTLYLHMPTYYFIFNVFKSFRSDYKNEIAYSSTQVVALAIVSHGYCVIDSFDWLTLPLITAPL